MHTHNVNKYVDIHDKSSVLIQRRDDVVEVVFLEDWPIGTFDRICMKKGARLELFGTKSQQDTEEVISEKMFKMSRVESR